MLEEIDSSHPRLQPKDVRNKNGRWLLPWPHPLSPLSVWAGQLFTSIRENHKGKSLHQAMNTNMLENTGFPSEPRPGCLWTWSDTLQNNPWRWMDQTPYTSMQTGAAWSYRICWDSCGFSDKRCKGDMSSLSSRKITLAITEHKGLCGSASEEESPGLPSRCCCWDSTSQSMQWKERGLCFGGPQPQWAGTQQKGLHSWVVTSWALQGGFGNCCRCWNCWVFHLALFPRKPHLLEYSWSLGSVNSRANPNLVSEKLWSHHCPPVSSLPFQTRKPPAVFGSIQLCYFTVFTRKWLTKRRLKLKESIQNYHISFFLISH